MKLLPPATAAALACVALLAQDPQPKQGGIPDCKDMQSTASGLQWGVLQPGGDGAPPGRDDSVKVHYTGWLTDGTKFDSSRDRGQPATFGVTQVIPGWTEGLQLMKPGMRCKFVIPGDIAYGPQGRPPKIPANATLVFDVELLDVIRMPEFKPGNPDVQSKLESGIKVEVTKAGTGKGIGDGDGVALRYAIWKPDGTLIDCSEKQQGRKLSGTLDSLPVDFLKDVVKSCKVGEIVRAEVPQTVFSNFQSDSVWELELVSVTTLPKFRMVDKAKVVTTQTGLRYEILEAGTGDVPKATNMVKAHYTGWLTNGTVFDSSHARGEPTVFPLNRVIPGWTEGLQLMKPGGKFLFEISPELGYGARASGKIPANSTLVFLVELVEVK